MLVNMLGIIHEYSFRLQSATVSYKDPPIFSDHAQSPRMHTHLWIYPEAVGTVFRRIMTGATAVVGFKLTKRAFGALLLNSSTAQ